MDGRLVEGLVRVGGDARQRFHDARGYGRPADGGGVDLAPVEAAHLLSRGDLDAVDGMGFRAFLAETGVVLPFVVFKDFRDRGFYLSPAREGWVADPGGADFVVHPRGEGPGGGARHRVRVVGERRPVPAGALGDVVLAVVDEDGEPTYLDTGRPAVTGTAAYDPPAGVGATLHGDRALAWDPPAELHERGFYGQRLYGRTADTGPLQLSLVEAAHLAGRGALTLAAGRVVERGRAVEGERFDRRLAVYRRLRGAGVVPKSGFKFGADFRTYDEFDSVESMGHSEGLVRVLGPDATFLPRDLALDVRLAGGVRKRMLFALTDGDGAGAAGAGDDAGSDSGSEEGDGVTAEGSVGWLVVSRLTP